MKRDGKVYGIRCTAPRPTRAALWLALRFIGLPLVAGLLVLDVLIWLLGLMIWDLCIGLWCWS